MDNNFNNQQQQYQQPQQPQQAQYQAQYQQPQYQQAQYQQPQYQQPQYQQAQYQQPYGQPYPQQAYGQPYPQQPSKLMANAKDVKNEFVSSFKNLGLSLWCLLGIIGAMLLVVAPFMNFASVHINQKVTVPGEYIAEAVYDMDDDMDYDDYKDLKKKTAPVKLKVAAADGMSIFELAKLSNTVDKLFDQYNKIARTANAMTLDKKDIADYADSASGMIVMAVREEAGINVEKTTKEAVGLISILTKGQLALNITPWLIIIAGLGLIVFTMINKKVPKLVCSGVALLALIWLMICTTNFFAVMGIGAWALIVGAALGVASAFLDKKN